MTALPTGIRAVPGGYQHEEFRLVPGYGVRESPIDAALAHSADAHGIAAQYREIMRRQTACSPSLRNPNHPERLRARDVL